MPRDADAADELASENLDGAYARRARAAASMRRMRGTAGIGQTVATG
jgi:hypothetical protein